MLQALCVLGHDSLMSQVAMATREWPVVNNLINLVHKHPVNKGEVIKKRQFSIEVFWDVADAKKNEQKKVVAPNVTTTLPLRLTQLLIK